MIVVPVEIAQFALSEGKEYPVHCFNLLKQETPGYTYLNKRQISILSDYLDRSNRTVRRYLSYLQGIGWIAPNGKVHTIKSWERIFKLMDFKYVAGVEFDVTKVTDPQAFYAGIVLGRLANFQKYKREGKGEGKSASFRQCASTQPSLPHFFPIADRALASILEISPSKANAIKKAAFKCGYIELKYNYWRYKVNNKPLQINRSDEMMFRRVFDDIGPKIRIDRIGRVFVQDADMVKPNLRYKKSRNYR